MRSRTSASATPSAVASSVVRVSSRPASLTPGTSMLSSTIASAISGSSPRSSASARNSERIALTIFSGAFSPSPVTGVAAPSVEPGRM